MKYNNVQPKIATIFLIHLINTVEGSDRVSRLLNMEFNHYRHERPLLDFQRNTVFNTLSDQSKSDFDCSLIITIKNSSLYTTMQILIAFARQVISKFKESIRLERTRTRSFTRVCK
jgi:hypothetical protein